MFLIIIQILIFSFTCTGADLCSLWRRPSYLDERPTVLQQTKLRHVYGTRKTNEYNSIAGLLKQHSFFKNFVQWHSLVLLKLKWFKIVKSLFWSFCCFNAYKKRNIFFSVFKWENRLHLKNGIFKVFQLSVGSNNRRNGQMVQISKTQDSMSE